MWAFVGEMALDLVAWFCGTRCAAAGCDGGVASWSNPIALQALNTVFFTLILFCMRGKYSS